MFEPVSADELVRVNQLTAVFTRIGEDSMKDIGLYNPALTVEAVGFRRWEDWLAGILVTPWFMNFILLPVDPAQLAGPEIGTRRRVAMPCGEVTCTIGEVDEIGRYLASSLYSPMGRFDVHQVAAATAWAAVNKFFQMPEVEEPAEGCAKR